MKPQLTSLIVLTACTAIFAQDPNDPCTNNCSWPTNEGPAFTYPPGSLQMRMDQLHVYVTNTIANHIYQITPLTGQWTNSNGAEKSFSFSITNDVQKFFLQELTFFDVTEDVEQQANIATCGGNYVASVDYYRDLNWGYPYNPVTSLHKIIDQSSNHWIEAVGRYGDVTCGFGSLVVTNQSSGHPFSPEYRFQLFFPTNAPSNYTVTFQGFIQ